MIVHAAAAIPKTTMKSKIAVEELKIGLGRWCISVCRYVALCRVWCVYVVLCMWVCVGVCACVCVRACSVVSVELHFASFYIYVVII